MALSTALQEAIWLQQLTNDLSGKVIKVMATFEDNQSAICLAKNQAVHGRIKHVDIKYHFVHDLVEAGRVDV